MLGGLGRATVAVADRTTFTLQGALVANFSIAAAAALLGIVVSRRVQVFSASRASAAART